MHDPAKPYVLRYLQTGSFAVMATPYRLETIAAERVA